jgi:Catalase
MKSASLRLGAQFAFLTLASAAAGVSMGAPAGSTEVTAPQMIDAFEGTFGVHPGQRRNHIKGTCAAGEFVGTTDAAALSRSALFSGKTIPVVARFSLGGGSPEVPDAAPAPRGMALEFHLPGGAIAKQPAWAAAINSSGFVPFSFSNRVLNEYAVSASTPESVERSPLPARPVPLHIAFALRIIEFLLVVVRSVS